MSGMNLRVPYSDGMDYGRGFESLTGYVRGFPLTSSTPKEVVDAAGQHVDYFLNKVETITELKTQLGLSAEVDARYGLFSASAKFAFSEAASFNSYSVFLVARVQVTNAFKTLKDAAFDDQALGLLKTSEGRKQFASQFGDSFVSGMSTGGEFCAVLELRTENSSDQKNLSASLSGSYGISAAGEAEFNTKLERASQSRFLKVSMYQAGGQGVQVTNSIEEVMARVKSFAQDVLHNPVPYVAQIVDYDTLDHPQGETWVDLDRAATVLKQFAEQKDRLLRIVNDIDFVRDNPEQFESPNMQVLNDAAMSAAERLNRLADNAREAVKNAANAEYIDVGVPVFDMPKRIEGALINVVSLVGLRMAVLRTALEQPTRGFTDYLSWATCYWEPGSLGVTPSREQYDFVTSGIAFEGIPSVGSPAGVQAFWTWVKEQDPPAGKMPANGTVALTALPRAGGGVPPELKAIVTI